MKELYLDEKGLIPKKDWKESVEGLQEDVKEVDDKEESKTQIKDALVSAVKKRLPAGRFGIFFSGGVDSSVIAAICKRLDADFVCYCVGFKTEDMDLPPDIVYAEKVATSLGVTLKTKVFDLDEAELIIKTAAGLLPKPKKADIDFVVKVGVGSVVVAAAGIAAEKTFFSGLGSEEIFAGYDRHSKASDINAECWNGLKMMWARDLIRDVTLADALGISIKTPFLDTELIKKAMKVPAKYKLDEENKKNILREVAEELGLGKEFAWRKKQGAQYGSKFDRAIEKLAKKHKFSTKGDYLFSLTR